MSRWPGRFLKLAGAVVTPVVFTMFLVHLNKSEIFRIGSTMMRSLNELRELQEGPFADPSVREKWDQQMKDKQFSKFAKVDPTIAAEYDALNYKELVDDSVRNGKI